MHVPEAPLRHAQLEAELPESSVPGRALILTHISRAERTHREVQPQLGSGWRSSLLSELFVDQQLAIDAEQRGGLGRSLISTRDARLVCKDEGRAWNGVGFKLTVAVRSGVGGTERRIARL